ncbi:MAG: hypothetical protein Terrestrivirus8_21 [Terrestrivirus sp.]|uniref:Uncharacterized protein n=1 Tax=Terrestrivirus sp. TaxID=2487775 RepID=A0A3G4ZNT8_9VIRU|nr:MAG: hypothetical protein Terrestrivirus8_21 [Terrestrivirus sp.]
MIALDMTNHNISKQINMSSEYSIDLGEKQKLIEKIIINLCGEDSKLFNFRNITMQVFDDLNVLLNTISQVLKSPNFPNNLKPIVEDDMTLKDTYGESFNENKFNLVLLFDKFGGDSRINYEFVDMEYDVNKLEFASNNLMNLFHKLSKSDYHPFEAERRIINVTVIALAEYFNEFSDKLDVTVS